MSLRSLNAYFFLFLTLGVLIFFFEITSTPLRSYIRQGVYLVFSPLLKTEREIREEIEKVILLVREIKSGTKLVSRYEKSLQELEVYKRKVEHYEDILSRLERDLNFSFPSGAPFVLSKIIFYDPSGEDRFFIIRDGKNKGIKKGDIVVARGYILGVVDEVYLSTSKVITLFNDNCSLLAWTQRNDKAYVYQGGYPLGKLLYVDLEDDVREGDEVLYRDLTMRIPPFGIGKVVYVGFSQNPFFKLVRVKPFITPRETEFVVVFKE
ncbi:MAG: rod shape-determining protein MreC [Aquificae bacterium]|nr:rod shape-determining protein MreC [Aquificota bacterium]